jgi:hypothetical protein
MEPEERELLHALFNAANVATGNGFKLSDERQSDVLVVDIDSIYGQMTWLRARQNEHTVIPLSAGSRSEPGLTLARPVSEAALTELMRTLLADAPPAKRSAPSTPGTATAAVVPAPAPAKAAVESVPVDAQPAPPAAPPPPPRAPRLGDYLIPGALSQPARIVRAGAEPLVLDPETRVYFGPGSLKALLPFCQGDMPKSELQPLDAAAFAEVVKKGGAQPMARLRWLFALVSGEGQLAEGYAMDERFSLSKWPQIEREFPKHFRIATAMMKGPATIAEIAETSTAPIAEVIDFVNANLASGFAQVGRVPEPEPEQAGKGGLFDRLRGKR